MKLFYKLLYIVIASLTISFTIFVISVVHLEEKNNKEILMKKIKNNEEVFKSTYSLLLYTLNKPVVRSLTDSIFKDEEIVKFEIKDKTTLLNLYLDKKSYENADLIESRINLIYDGDELGELIIHYSDQTLDEHIKEYKLNIFTFSVIVVILLTLILYKFVGSLNSTLRVLTDAIVSISKGDLSKKVLINSKDEFGKLAKSFENMRISLESRKKLNEKQANEIKKLNEELQHKIKERTKELENSNDELKNSIKDLNNAQKQLIESEKLASLGSLVAGISHEINTPVGVSLTASTHFKEMVKKIKKEYEKDEITEQGFEKFLYDSNEVSNLIETNLNKTAKLVKSFKQIAVDQTSEQKRKFEIKSYMYEILFSISSIIKKTNIEVYVDGDKVEIDTYAGAFSQVFSNLIINSISHGFEKNQEGNIHINIKKVNDMVRIMYIDNGKGIPRENLKKIYDPFFTTNREHGGTGLGMNIVYNIITSKLGGHIICCSEVDRGVEFTITIPLNKKDL